VARVDQFFSTLLQHPQLVAGKHITAAVKSQFFKALREALLRTAVKNEEKSLLLNDFEHFAHAYQLRNSEIRTDFAATVYNLKEEISLLSRHTL
jgi:truncated hemoglobin YjbI